jgi:hypothetical protein
MALEEPVSFRPWPIAASLGISVSGVCMLRMPTTGTAGGCASAARGVARRLALRVPRNVLRFSMKA